VAAVLRETRADVLISYLPVGSEEATRWYAEQALEAGCALINCVPVFIASDPAWSQRFAEKGLPIIGDDINRRSAPPLHIEYSRTCFANAACASTAPISSTSAATPIS
jgi:myo-inositol-1-phosphate synthase